MRTFAYLDGDTPVLYVNGFCLTLSNKELESLLQDLQQTKRAASAAYNERGEYEPAT